MPLIIIQDDEEIRTTIASAKPDELVILEFMMAECGSCKSMKPKLEELRQKYPTIIFLEVDISLMSDTADAFDIKVTPTFLFIKNRNVLSSFFGNKADKFEEMMKQCLKSAE